jgi:hypothetical protein
MRALGHTLCREDVHVAVARAIEVDETRGFMKAVSYADGDRFSALQSWA